MHVHSLGLCARMIDMCLPPLRDSVAHWATPVQNVWTRHCRSEQMKTLDRERPLDLCRVQSLLLNY